MEALGNLFTFLFINPLINALVAIYHVLDGLRIPYSLGFSIIILTIIIRFILWPFTAKQLAVTKKMQLLSPELAKVKEKYKKDPKRLQEETMALYRKHEINPLGGCLPTLVQFMLFPALYNVFQTFVGTDKQAIIDKFNDVLYFPFLTLSSLQDPTFFGLPLGESPSKLLATMPLILLVPVLTAALQFVQSKMMFPPIKKDPKAAKKEPDFQSTFQTQLIYIIPVTIAFAAYTFPIGLALYWNTFTVFAMIQQYKMNGWGGLAPWIAKIRGQSV